MSVQFQPPQDNEEILRLIRIYQQTPTEEVKTMLVQQYTGLVYFLARRFVRSEEQFEDIVQVGMVGLLAALSRFDTSLGNHFHNFAIPTIVGEIKRYIRDNTWSVQVPRRVKELGPKIKRALEHLTAEFQRSPQIDELAAYLNVSTEEILETMEMGLGYQALSMDSPIEADRSGGKLTLLDVVGRQETGFEQVNQRLVLEGYFDILEEREAIVLQLAFLEELSQKEIGLRLGISQMHVSRVQRKALRKIKESLEQRMLS